MLQLLLRGGRGLEVRGSCRHVGIAIPGISQMPAVRKQEAIKLQDGSKQLVMAADGRWFEQGGQRVDVSRRAAPRRILQALGSAKDALSVTELFAVGWPGEVIHPLSQSRRVHTAVWTLRRLGLEQVVIRETDGYRLARGVKPRLVAD